MSVIWKILIFLVMSVIIVAAFLTPPPQRQIGEASRIFYFHVPQAWVAVLAFLVSMIASIKYLAKGRPLDDDRALVAAQLGFMFCILATVSGSLFAKVAWHSFWNWDPREVSIFILLIIYAAYFALRSAIEDPIKRAKLASVYSIFAFATVPYLVFIMPRVFGSLHPENTIVDQGKIAMSTTTSLIFFPALAVFTALFFWIYIVAIRVYKIQRVLMEEYQ